MVVEGRHGGKKGRAQPKRALNVRHQNHLSIPQAFNLLKPNIYWVLRTLLSASLAIMVSISIITPYGSVLP